MTVGVEAERARQLNAPFFTAIQPGRPFVIAKAARERRRVRRRSAGAVDGDQPPASLRKVQQLRAEVDAIAVGVGTMLVDDPRLTVRDVYRARPFVRVIFDRRLRTPPGCARILDARFRPGSPLLRRGAAEARPEQVTALERAGACIERTDGTLDAAFRRLAALGVLTCSSRAGAAHPPGRRRSGYDRRGPSVHRANCPGPGRGADGGRRETLDPLARSPCGWRWWAPTCRSPAMFTGLIEAVGDVVAVEQRPGAVRLYIGADLAESLQVGESVAVNGVCLTGVEAGGPAMAFDIGPETMRVTALGGLEPGDRVNLERAMRADSRFGGHFVLGHADGIGTVVDVRPDGDFWWMKVRFAEHLASLFVPKGAVAVDGISLTVARWPTMRSTCRSFRTPGRTRTCAAPASGRASISNAT